MNLKGLPFEDSPHGALYVAVMTAFCTALLLWWMKKRGWS
jgi:magnesium transporter